MIGNSRSFSGRSLVTVRSTDTSAVDGVLVADDIVFVPHPPARLLAAPKFTVVIRAGSADQGPEESIAVTDVRLLSLDDGKVTASLAVFTLAEPSTLRRKVPQYSAAKLGEAIAEHRGNLWAALASLGYAVPADAGRDGAPDPAPALRAFADREAQPAELHDSVAAFADSGCDACGCCLPPQQRSTDGDRRS